MTRDEKIAFMLKDLGEKGIKKYTAAPPLYRLLWRLGFDVAPPLFASFWLITLQMGVFFAVGWGVVMWFWVWQGQGLPPIFAIIASAGAGVCFGLAMAAYYRWRWRKLGLPRWEDYPAGQAQKTS